MDRADALAFLNASGFDGLMTKIGRATTDTANGYGPSLDRAFRIHIERDQLTTGPLDTVVDDEDVEGFCLLLRATTFDLVLVGFATMVDSSVDAPLTNMKLSQAYRQIKELRDDAWRLAGEHGYGESANASGMKVNLDFLEPADAVA